MVAFIVFIAVLLMIGIMEPRYGVVMAPVALLLVLAVSVSAPGRFAESLHEFDDHAVAIHVWGQPLPKAGATCSIKRIVYYGASIRLYLSHDVSSIGELKIAKPRGFLVNKDKSVVYEAAYVRWAGERLIRVSDRPAVSISRVK